MPTFASVITAVIRNTIIAPMTREKNRWKEFLGSFFIADILTDVEHSGKPRLQGHIGQILCFDEHNLQLSVQRYIHRHGKFLHRGHSKHGRLCHKLSPNAQMAMQIQQTHDLLCVIAEQT